MPDTEWFTCSSWTWPAPGRYRWTPPHTKVSWAALLSTCREQELPSGKGAHKNVATSIRAVNPGNVKKVHKQQIFRIIRKVPLSARLMTVAKGIKWSEVAQSCPTLCDPVDCSPPGSSVHGILQARILEWVTISFSRGSSRPRDWTRVSHIGGRRFNLWAATQKE